MNYLRLCFLISLIFYSCENKEIKPNIIVFIADDVSWDDIGIYGNPSYYFQYDSQEFRNLMDALNLETNDKERSKILKNAQKLIADDYVNGYLFQLAKTGVANSKLIGLWKNSPTQANDLTGVSWSN